MEQFEVTSVSKSVEISVMVAMPSRALTKKLHIGFLKEFASGRRAKKVGFMNRSFGSIGRIFETRRLTVIQIYNVGASIFLCLFNTIQTIRPDTVKMETKTKRNKGVGDCS